MNDFLQMKKLLLLVESIQDLDGTDLVSEDVYIETFINECIAFNRTLCESNVYITEGIVDNLKSTAKKISKTLEKAKDVPADAIRKMHINVWSKIQDQLDKDQQNKIIEFARKNAKYAKPALMIAIIGASLLGAEATMAGEVVDSLDSLSGTDVQAVADVATTKPELPSDFADKFLRHVESEWKRVNRKIALNGTVLSFEQVIEVAEQETNVDVREFINWIVKQKNMNVSTATEEVTRFLTDGTRAWAQS